MPENHEKIGLQIGQPINVKGVWYRLHAKRRRDLVLRRLTPAELDYIKKDIKKRSQHALTSAEP